MFFLHLMDDEKFIDAAIHLFETCNPGNNIYLIGTPYPAYQLKHVTCRQAHTAVDKSLEYYQFLHQLKKEDIVVVHYLDYSKGLALQQLPFDNKVVWLAYGAEFYNSPFYKGRLYHPFTKRIVYQDRTYISRWIKDLMRKPYSFFSKRSSFLVFKDALKKVRYFSPPVPEETVLYKKSIPGFNPKQVQFRYGAIEQTLDTLLDKNIVLKDSIFVGNSNTPSSNHLDVFKHLEAIGCTKRNVLVPLSYGGSEFYKRKIISEGTKIFGSHFKPILTFMDKKSYLYKVLGSCRTAILFHERQQGLGNVILLVWLGAKVFLSENNPIYPYFKRLNIALFSFQKATAKDIDDPLPEALKISNREHLMQEFGIENALRQVKALIQTVTADPY